MASKEHTTKGQRKDNDLSLIEKIKGEKPSINYWPYVTKLNMSRSLWGQGSVYDKNPEKLNFVLFRYIATNTIQYLTLLDLWHPSDLTGKLLTPPDSLPRSELVVVNSRAFDIFSRHQHHIVEMRLCSCICNFGPDELKRLLAKSIKLKSLFLRCFEMGYDYLEMLRHKDFETLYLETNIVELNELTRRLQMMVSMKVFILKCYLVHKGRKLENHDFGMPLCRISALQGFDPMTKCRRIPDPNARVPIIYIDIVT